MFTQAEWVERLKSQEELEEFAHYEGRDRFTRRLEKAQEGGRGSAAGAARKLLVECIEPTERAIAHVVGEYNNKGAGRRPLALRWVRALGTDVAAFMTCRVVLDGIHEDKQDHGSVARHVSTLILHELRYRRFREQAPGLFHYRLNSFDTDSYAHRSRSLNNAMSYAGVDVSDLDMTQRERIIVGAWLIDLFIQATGLVQTETETARSAGKVSRRVWLVTAGDTQEWLKRRNTLLSESRPVKLPMLVPPLPWRPGDRGGYRFRLRALHPLLRGDEDIGDLDLPIVHGALNRLQDTAWRINEGVYEVVREIERRGGGLAGVPKLELEPEPTLWDTYTSTRGEERFADVRLEGEEPEGPEEQVKALLREHRYRLGRVKNRNHYRKVDDLTFRRALGVAERFLGERAFWFPYSADFRGRVYPLTDCLSPQGPDLEKALLMFADRRPMGVLGGKWLAIHLMNCLDETPGGRKVSTMTLYERQAWVEDNEELVLQVGRDPWADPWWMEADEPLQFYAACREWALWADSGYSTEYLCGLPVSMDGSCNGLQHFAAMFRDEVGARAVNVSPSDQPQDVYLLVAEAVKDRLEREAFDNPLAMMWLTSGLVDRKLCKRPTMTFGYGSKPYGFTKQLREYLEKDCDWTFVQEHFSEGDEDRTFEAAGYMAKAIWQALGGVVVKAFEAMTWLQACARQIAAKGKPVEWAVPLTGFPVRQDYWHADMKRVDTVLAGGASLRLSYHEANEKVEEHKQANAVAPNVVHSLDAAALMLTVQAAAAEGIEAFGMVHDSYATVPGDAQLLSEILRQEFVYLYEHDIPGMLRDQWADQLAEGEIPEPPAPGSLDLHGVLVSPFFFS